MADRPWTRIEDFPPEVHLSLLELQEIAVKVTSRHDPRLRRATQDEIDLAQLFRKPYHCTGTSVRTGLPCRKTRVTGTTFCTKHGASFPCVKDARDRRLQLLAGPVMSEMVKMAFEKKTSKVKFAAAQDLLDRAGVGAVVEAKVRASYRGQPLSGVTVQIGFMALPEGDGNGQALLPAAGDVIDGETAEAQGDRAPGAADPATAADERNRP